MNRAVIANLDPTIVSGLKAWYKADSITGLTDAQSVTSWLDSSGAGNNLVTGVAAPTYRTNQINGYPIVRFARASTQNLTKATPTGLNVAAFTYFVVLKRNTASGAQNHSMVHVGASAGGRQFRFENDKLNFTKTNTTDIQSSIGTLTDTTNYYLVELLYNNTNSEILFRQNGESQGKFRSAQTFTDTSASIWIGKNGVNTTEYLDADVAEILLFDNALIEIDRISIRQYLANKYNAFGIITTRTAA